jgi:hypothetical protein
MSTVMEPPPHVQPAAAPSGLSQQDTHRLTLVRHLIATMMLGQAHGLRDDVERVFEAIAKMLGDGRPMRISLAFASAVSGDVNPARDLLAEDLDSWPDAQMSRVSIALALKVGGDPQWKDVVERVLAVSDDEATRSFARQVLDTPISSELEP